MHNSECDLRWPEGKDFAFTIFDDTDCATLENVSPVYSLLAEFGFRTTKSIWPTSGSRTAINRGATCEDLHYMAWLKRLQQSGFEIAYHLATYHTSERDETRIALERFHSLFGHYPYSMANHTGCHESLYWGNYRLSGLNSFFYNILTGFRNYKKYRGHLVADPLFWGDLCQDKIKYVRGFVFPDINTLKACPIMPYYDPVKPLVNYWFSSSEGSNVQSFNSCLAEHYQDRLEQEGGACIMYTHFAYGFCEDGKPNSRFTQLIERLHRKNGWFVPVTTLLDHLLTYNGRHILTPVERRTIEKRWLRHKLSIGTT